VIFDSKIVDGILKVFVIRSFLRDVNVGDELIKVNGIPALKYIKETSNKYMKKTHSETTNLKKFILYMCILNPFDVIDSFELL
jgi:hypothetical protein